MLLQFNVVSAAFFDTLRLANLLLQQDNEVNAGHPEMSSVVKTLLLQSSSVRPSLTTVKDFRKELPVIDRLVKYELREILRLSTRLYAPMLIDFPEMTFLLEDDKYRYSKVASLLRFMSVNGLPYT